MRLLHKTLGFLLVGLVLGSCLKEPEFSFTPSISFEDISSEIRLDQFIGATKDSVVVSIHFEDGDGDLGLGETEKQEAQQTDDFNYLIKSFRKKNGIFEAFEPLIPLSGYFPKLTLDEKPGPIEGVLSYTIEFFHAFTPESDTLKFEIQIKDRSGNLSNTAETEEIVLNQIDL